MAISVNHFGETLDQLFVKLCFRLFFSFAKIFLNLCVPNEVSSFGSLLGKAFQHLVIVASCFEL